MIVLHREPLLRKPWGQDKSSANDLNRSAAFCHVRRKVFEFAVLTMRFTFPFPCWSPHCRQSRTKARSAVGWQRVLIDEAPASDPSEKQRP
jgi:hypothetical protein